MTRTYDLIEIKPRSIFACVVSESGRNLLRLSASFERTNIISVHCEVISPFYVGFALVADEQRRFMTNLQALLFGGRTIEDLKILSKKISLANCDELLF